MVDFGTRLEERAAKALFDHRQLCLYGKILTKWRSPEMDDNYLSALLAEVRVVLAVVEAFRQETQFHNFDPRANPDPISG